MGELLLILGALFVYIVTACICAAGYLHQGKKHRLRFTLGFVPVLNFIIAISYLSLFFSHFGGDTVSGIFEEDNTKLPSDKE